MKKISIIFLVASSIIIINFTSCTKDDFTDLISETEEEENNDITVTTELTGDHEENSDYIWDNSDIVKIELNGSSISVNGDGATVDGSVVTIYSAGNYEMTGSLNDGQVILDTDDEETVRLILNGVNITNTTNAPINIANSEKTIIVLAENTTNYLTDSDNYIFEGGEEDGPNAALYSADDLTIFGEGTLVVNANYKDGITSKDGLIIKSGIIDVSAEDDGIRGKDYLIIKDGNITVNAEDQGLVSDNDENSEKGYISVETGVLNINSTGDNLNSANIITINGGILVLASGDDAIHSDAAIVINDGDINITSAVEGIESPSITINDGIFDIVTSDDAINAVGNSTNNNLYINGGYMVINCSGDGLDSNGNIEMNDGTVIINGPTAQNNSPLDYDGQFDFNGGFLIGTGYASNMDEAGSSSSDQNSLLIKLNSIKTAGSLVHIENSNGGNILTFAPSKKYKSIVFSSPELSTGSTYKVYFGGTSTGTETDGLYEDGTYTSGSLYNSFTISGAVTNVN